MLARLADATPMLLAIDDAHWLDQPSLRLLEFLVPRVEELRALMVAATRPPKTDGDHSSIGRIELDPVSDVIRLAPLSRSAVAEVVRTRLGGEPNPAFVHTCAEVTAGNPFYLTELLRELRAGGIRPDWTRLTVRTVGPRSISLALRLQVASSDALHRSDRDAAARRR